MSNPALDLDAIAAAAKAATKGPLEVHPTYAMGFHAHHVTKQVGDDREEVAIAWTEADARFIALISPANVVAMVALLGRLIDDLRTRHPLPWTTEVDWTVEIHDARGEVALRCMTMDEAQAIIEIAARRLSQEVLPLAQPQESR